MLMQALLKILQIMIFPALQMRLHGHLQLLHLLKKLTGAICNGRLLQQIPRDKVIMYMLRSMKTASHKVLAQEQGLKHGSDTVHLMLAHLSGQTGNPQAIMAKA